MDRGLSLEQGSRVHYRHELRTLTYVTLDQANGGIVRNLTHDGIGVQAVASVRPRQQLRVRFELRYPRLRIETRGEVVWSTFSGQCGIRFLDLPPRLHRQIDEWIFGNLLEGAFQDVWIEGEVRVPGKYTTSGQARLRDAIYLAGGITSDADLDSAQIFRSNQDGSLKILSVNLQGALAGRARTGASGLVGQALADTEGSHARRPSLHQDQPVSAVDPSGLCRQGPLQGRSP